MAVAGKSVAECEVLLSTDVPITEYHKLSHINMFKETLADVIQVKVGEIFILAIKSGEGMVMLKLRLVLDSENEEEKTDLFKSAVAENILAKSLSQKGLNTSSVSFSGKLEVETITEEAKFTKAGEGGATEAMGEDVDEQRDRIMLQQMQMQQVRVYIYLCDL
jgi:hypothetical protein